MSPTPRTLLVGDDSSTIRRIVELTYADSEFRVEGFADGASLLARLRELPTAVVLADLVMPGPCGYDLCRQAKAISDDVAVVLLAGAFEPLDADEARACGADGSLTKPFEAEALREAVRDALDGAASDRAEDEPIAQAVDPTEEVHDEAWVESVADRVVARLSTDGWERIVRAAAEDVVREIAPEIVRQRIRELEDEA